MITLAIFIASIVAYGFVTYVNHGWQYIQVSLITTYIISYITTIWEPY